MRIVITGGSGFIGSQTALHLQHQHEILIVDKFSSVIDQNDSDMKPLYLGSYENLIGFKGRIHSGDITEESTMQIIYDFEPEVIFHFAAISDTTVKDQRIMFGVNINPFNKLLDYTVNKKIRLIYASSASVYGTNNKPNLLGNEMPNTPYSFSKMMMDNIASRYFNDNQIIGLRYFNVYGNGEYFKGKSSSVILQFALQILSGESIKLFKGSENYFRDFVYINDVLSANVKSLSSLSGIYNVGMGKSRSFQEVATIIKSQLNSSLPDQYFENPYSKTYQKNTIAVLDEKFDFKPKYPLELGIENYIPHIIDYYNKNQQIFYA